MSSFDEREVDFFDPEISERPHGAYKILQEKAPVWKDPKSGMYIVSFKVLLERIDEMWFLNDFRHHPNFCLRELRELHIGFTRCKPSA